MAGLAAYHLDPFQCILVFLLLHLYAVCDTRPAFPAESLPDTDFHFTRQAGCQEFFTTAITE